MHLSIVLASVTRRTACQKNVNCWSQLSLTLHSLELGETGYQLTTNHATGPESIASDVNNPSNLINKADVDNVEDDAQQSDDEASDSDSERLDVIERRDDVARVTKVQQ